MATPFTEGLAATHEIAIGGSDLNGHTIRVGPMEGGKILIDGQPALTSFPSSQDILGAGYLSYNSDGNLVDKAQGDLEKHVVHISLENGHSVQVMRWANHINVRIFTHFAEKLRSLTDGLCGNFNNDPSDDTPELVDSRNAANVAERDCMFDHRGSFKPTATHAIEECKKDAERLARSGGLGLVASKVHEGGPNAFQPARGRRGSSCRDTGVAPESNAPLLQDASHHGVGAPGRAGPFAPTTPRGPTSCSEGSVRGVTGLVVRIPTRLGRCRVTVRTHPLRRWLMASWGVSRRTGRPQ